MFEHGAELLYLSDVSPRDKRWDSLKSESLHRAGLYAEGEIYNYAERLDGCARFLNFATATRDDGLVELYLRSAWFCRVRLCPICKQRRSVMWKARTINALPKILNEYPKAQFLFLTLTVKNCPVTELRSQLKEMNHAWRKLTLREKFPAIGWMRMTEVTRSEDDYAHPHFHILLMVKPVYFSHNYVSHKAWVELWKDCLKVSYTPVVDIRKIRPKDYAHNQNPVQSSNPKYAHTIPHPQKALIDAVSYSLGYGTKATGLESPKKGKKRTENTMRMSEKDWLLALTNQLHKTRMIATGGVLKKCLKEVEDEYQDLIHADPDAVNPHRSDEDIAVSWRERVSRYVLDPALEVGS